ncbi:hypothetical protein KGF56_001896 [Candida oxycetoniae]|uniref:Uncharacterized protein n=1 Tax=Candida oxycetoniae TaxID=497107 RepID=A0AAI9SYU5_9ASCO|nr:uncharacterized protein KGF56_001896 [Candida oxycetoniae]KAI3405299.2 hypothetical protein KGF56_001896 [Candida oxycetoniae]
MVKVDVHISPCHRYISQIKIDAETTTTYLEIIDVSTKRQLWKFDLHSVLRKEKVKVRVDEVIQVKQTQWEGIQVGSRSTKLAVLVDRYSMVLIFDVRDAHSRIIVIKQNFSEGIESFLWIPPADTASGGGGGDGDGGGGGEGGKSSYMNCTQLLIFAKNNLSAKLYSLDCPKKLYTIHKPLSNCILCSRNGRIQYWSIIADTMEYNVPPTIYQFYNSGSTSTLVAKCKLSAFLTNEATIDWSHSGSWLSILDGSDKLSGYSLKIYGSLSIGVLEPTLDIELSEKEDTFGERLMKIYNDKFRSNWVIFKEKEYLLISNILNGFIEIQVVSIDLLRIVQLQNLELTSLRGWIETDWKVEICNHFAAPNRLAISLLSVRRDNLMFIILNDVYCLCYKIHAHEYKLSFEYITMLKTKTPISFIEKAQSPSNDLFIITKRVIFKYEEEDASFKIVATTSRNIQSVAFLSSQDFVVIYSDFFGGKQWEKLRLSAPSLGDTQNTTSNSLFTQEDITDTFHMQKKSKAK